MSLPPGFLDELRTRTSLTRVVGRRVVWDPRKSNQGKGDMWAPCPFHQEKTASFHVDERKGYYYCFGCQAKGDALSFLRETENMGFMEAVEALATEAGMQMPAVSPENHVRRDHLAGLAEVMEAAVRHYRMMLRGAAAGQARAYLAGRGLPDAALARFEIGFAPDARGGLLQALSGQGIAVDQMIEAGLVALPDGGGAPYDRFRDRIIFPIRDARGRCIGLGGRAMAADARAKYLNSPETALFDKGRSLYNHGPAREAAGKGQPLIVAEGYMDVIALVQAGFEASVAPLGTAITESQLEMMWRISPEPVIALDGDKAGLRAAMRLMDLALPLLEAGRGLRFCLLPQGMDPDDLVRSQGADALRGLLDAAVPMVSLLWQRETEGRVFDSPERRAGLDKTLRSLIAKIKDPSVRSHYGAAIAELRFALFAAARPAKGSAPVAGMGVRRGVGKSYGNKGFGGKSGAYMPPQPPLGVTRKSFLGNAVDGAENNLREAVILAVLAVHPTLIVEFEPGLAQLQPRLPDHASLQRALLAQIGPGSDDDKRKAIAIAAGDALERVMVQSHVRIVPAMRSRDDRDLARSCVAEELAKLHARRAVAQEIEDAMEDLGGLPDEGLTWRLTQATAARQAAERVGIEDSLDLGEDRAALSKGLQSLIDSQVWVRKPR